MTPFPIRKQNKSYRARAIIGSGDVFTPKSTAVIPKGTFVDVYTKRTAKHRWLFLKINSSIPNDPKIAYLTVDRGKTVFATLAKDERSQFNGSMIVKVTVTLS